MAPIPDPDNGVGGNAVESDQLPTKSFEARSPEATFYLRILPFVAVVPNALSHFCPNQAFDSTTHGDNGPRFNPHGNEISVLKGRTIMNLSKKGFLVATPAVFIGLFAAASFVPSINAQFRSPQHPATCIPSCDLCNCAMPSGTTFAAGADLENLQVHVTGPTFGDLEIYFRNEFFRDTPPQGRNLHVNNLAIAPPSAFGTFSVRLGSNDDTFKVYGWKKNDTAPVTYGPITPDPGNSLCLYWITSRILKVAYGPNHQKTQIIRFNDSDSPWTILYKTP